MMVKLEQFCQWIYLLNNVDVREAEKRNVSESATVDIVSVLAKDLVCRPAVIGELLPLTAKWSTNSATIATTLQIRV